MTHLLLLASILARPAVPRVTVERRVALMGTTADIAVVAAERPAGLDASERALRELSRVEDLLTTWRSGGQLARLNLSAVGEEHVLDAELFEVLSEVFAWSERTGRAFDPTVLPLVRAWGLREGGRIPSPA